MATTARLLALLDLLQDRGWVSGDEIAQRLETEPRTVRRDLARLVDLGLPVESRRGRHGGYRLRPGYRMPPLMLTDDEAAAVVVALVAAERLGLATATPAVTGALSKIRRVLPARLREQVSALEPALGFTRAPGGAAGNAAADVDAPALLRLGEAVRRHLRVRLSYDTPGRGERERDVDPYGVVVSGRRWYLSAFDHDSGELRTFRVDRIRDVRIGPVTEPPPAGFDPVAAVSDALARTPWRWEVVALVDADPAELRRRLPAWTATLTGAAHGRTRVTMRAENLEGAVRILAGLGLPFELVNPPELRTLLADHARQLLASSRPPGQDDGDDVG